MKRTAKVAGSLVATVSLAAVLFFFLVVPARAPVGGKLWTGGRTIASLQEEDFDRRLLKLQLCYGVRIVSDRCTLGRRRVCKAMLVHELEPVFERSGAYLKNPVEFHCHDTAVGKSILDDEDSVSLRPNLEMAAIRRALDSNLVSNHAVEEQHDTARAACEFLTDCKWSMRPQSFSVRKIASCISTPNAAHRKALLNEAGAMLFGGKATRRNSLYSRIMNDGK